MVAIPRKREIIDGRALAAALQQAAGRPGEESQRRQRILGLARDAWTDGFAEIRRRHMEEAASGRRTAQELTYLADRLIEALYQTAVKTLYPRHNPTDAEHLAVIATGGYGRGELAPYSDLDLLFVYPHKATAWHEQIIEFLLYNLWDLGLTVGHAVRSPQECLRLARKDLSIRTGLLEMRRLTGPKAIYDDLVMRFRNEVVAGSGPEFVEAKLAERDARHARMGDSRYVVEPNLKEGKGGLRDLHTLFWIARYLYGVHRPRDLLAEGILEPDELKAFRKAERFLWTVRCRLHFINGRANERLTFDVQPELARQLQYKERAGLSAVERFMKHYFLVAKQVGDLTRVVCAALESRHMKKPLFSLERFTPARPVKGFLLDSGRLTVRRESVFRKSPEKMVTIFAVAQETGYDIHPDALRWIGRNLSFIDASLRKNERVNAAFLRLLTSMDHPEIHLTRMNEAGVLGRFLPDFGRIVAQMQYDMYHHFTVDAHTIRAIGLLAKIERGELAEDHPLSNEIIHKVVSRRSLFLAVLLHDIGKGRGGDHSRIGERIARKLGPRLGLSPAETDLAAWLVRWHLLMSQYAFRRDIADRKTIQDFCEKVKSPERLRQLLILTVVDIRAVGPGIWNGWKGQLLRDLYYQAEEVLIAGHAAGARRSRVEQKKQALSERLDGWTTADIEAFLARFRDAYWIAEDLETIEQNVQLIRSADAKGEAIAVSAEIKPFQDMTEISVYTRDRPGLFARLAGALAVAGANVVDAKIHTTRDGKALDNFRVQARGGEAFDSAARSDELEKAVRAAVVGKLPAEATLKRRREGFKRRTAVFRVEPLVLIDNRASNRATVIEVNARDRPGLLYDLTRALSRLRVSVASAHVATYGERAVDVFYVQGRDAEKISGPKRQANIEKALQAAARGKLPPKREEAGKTVREPAHAG